MGVSRRNCRRFFVLYEKVEKKYSKKINLFNDKKIRHKNLFLNNKNAYELVLDIATNNKNTRQGLLTGTSKKLKMKSPTAKCRKQKREDM